MTTTITILSYEIDGKPREWWFREDPQQPRASAVTLAIDPPVTLTADPAGCARAKADNFRARGIDVEITTKEV